MGGGHPLRRSKLLARGALLGFAVALAACGGGIDDPTVPTSTTASSAAPADPAPRTGFVVFGDFGGGLAQGAVAEAMERWAAVHEVDALVTTGDNVYTSGEPRHFEAQLDEPYAQLREGREFWVTLGNHDVAGGFGDEQLDHLGLPDLPYAKELPGVQILFLDGNRPDEKQAAWLDERLSEPGPAFRVVSFHQPAYSCGPHGHTIGVIQEWVPVFEEHGVALVLSGHDHLYQRLVAEGVTYVVTGGGGRPLYELDATCRWTPILEASAEEHHFVSVEVEGDTMTITAVAADGEVLDRHVVTSPS